MKKTPPHLPDEEQNTPSQSLPLFKVMVVGIAAGLCGGGLLMYYVLPAVLSDITAPLRTPTITTVEKTPEKVAYENIEQVVVDVMRNNAVFGAGVSISNDGLVVTDASVVGKNLQIAERNASRDITRTMIDTASGLAIVATPETSRGIAKTADIDEVMGTRFFVYVPKTGIVETSATARFFSKDPEGMLLSDSYDRVIPLAIPMVNVVVGAPVFTANGDCVGIIGETKTPQGFATFTPISRIMEVYKQLVKDGEVERASLGISARDFGSDNEVAVVSVVKGSAADRAGIKVLDKITAIEGKSVGRNYGIAEIILQYKTGKKISVMVNGEVKEVELGGQKTSVVY